MAPLLIDGVNQNGDKCLLCKVISLKDLLVKRQWHDMTNHKISRHFPELVKIYISLICMYYAKTTITLKLFIILLFL